MVPPVHPKTTNKPKPVLNCVKIEPESGESSSSTSTHEMSANGVVLRKLFFFSVALFTLPIAAYFICETYVADLVLEHNSKFRALLSGGAAAMSVNVILAIYVYLALSEDTGYGRGAIKENDGAASLKKD